MQTYQVQISVLGTHNDESVMVWSNRGTVKGKSIPSMLRRAYYGVFGGNFDAHPQRGATMFHVKYHDMPILRLVSVGTPERQPVGA